MQSEPNEIYQQIPIDSSFPDKFNTTQHGLSNNDQQPSLQHRADSGDYQPLDLGSSSPETGSDTSSQGSDRATNQLPRRLNSRRQTTSPGDRISKHEHALEASSKKKGRGPAFSVIQNKTSGGGLGLVDFPNGSISCDRLVMLANTYPQRF